MSKGQWFGFDPHDSRPSALAKSVGRVAAVFAVTLGGRRQDDGHQCFVYIDVFGATVHNYTDRVVDLGSITQQKCIPLKSLCSAFWLVSHWDPATYPPKSILLLIKHL